ncbi:MAG: monooxygenase [Pycnora praestabilis]|nr:MAG: monooxygenase [Pycnora praestabilis]
MAEFSDVPLNPPPPEETYFDLFPAKCVTTYLEKYVDSRIYGGRSLRDRMIFNYRVQKVEKIDGKWAVHGSHGQEQTSIFYASNLMMANGLTSTPKMPDLANQSKYGGLLIHQEAFGQSSVLTSPEFERIAVLGGSKSAADMVYASAKAGKSVSWIIRKSGSGPGAFISAKGMGRYKNSPEFSFTRVMSSFSPSYFNPTTWWTRFLHGNVLGRWLLNVIWSTADGQAYEEANYHGRDGARKGFEKLETDTSCFWCNDSLGLIQQPDFWETIAKNVQIYRNDVQSLEENSICLDDGTVIPCEALLCGTGWTQSHNIFDGGQLSELGLPYSIDNQSTEEAATWTRLSNKADRKVVDNFPRLADPPPYYKKPLTTTPYRLYNFIAPLNDDSVVFLGYFHISNNFRAAECQALWVTAYLDKRVALPSYKEMQEDIALTNAWCKRRYLANGEKGNYLHYELIGYTDRLLNDLGLSSHRKGWWEDFFAPCAASDLRNIREEYMEKWRNKSEDKKTV